MSKVVDRVGLVFGKLTICRHSHSKFRSSRHGYYQFWECQCECGNKTIVLYDNLKKGNTTSCGCMASRKKLKERATKHGMCRTKTFKTWQAMLDRCRYENHISWKYYGARGITVCDRWKKFENFLNDMGQRPAQKTLDRINPDGNYEPGNCRWATAKEQRANRRPRCAANEIVKAVP